MWHLNAVEKLHDLAWCRQDVFQRSAKHRVAEDLSLTMMTVRARKTFNKTMHHWPKQKPYAISLMYGWVLPSSPSFQHQKPCRPCPCPWLFQGGSWPLVQIKLQGPVGQHKQSSNIDSFWCLRCDQWKLNCCTLTDNELLSQSQSSKG